MSSRTIRVPFSVLVNVPVTLTVKVPYDEEGEPDLGCVDIVNCELHPCASVSVTDARESMDEDTLEALDEAIEAALHGVR